MRNVLEDSILFALWIPTAFATTLAALAAAVIITPTAA